MPGLDSYLISLGVKGQNVVLSTMEKIRKSGEKLTKKKNMFSIAADIMKGGAGVFKPQGNQTEPTPGEKKNNREQSEAVKKFGEGVKNFSGAAASLDPTATLQSINSAIGTSLSGVIILGESLGRLPEGIAAISNNILSMAKNSMDMAKQSTAAFKQLADRNATMSYYGSNLSSGGNQLSRNELSMMIDAISGSMGKIQKPLADEINKLVNGKDTRALARASAGDWESTGTDKGWLLQQMSNGMQGMPPSIKQSFQAAMLRQNADLIQNQTGEQRGAQRNAAAFANMEEDQTARMYKATLNKSGGTDRNVYGMMEKFNTMQLKLYDVGLGFTAAIDKTINTISALPASIERMKKSLDDFSSDPSMKRAKQLVTDMRIGQ